MRADNTDWTVLTVVLVAIAASGVYVAGEVHKLSQESLNRDERVIAVVLQDKALFCAAIEDKHPGWHCPK